MLCVDYKERISMSDIGTHVWMTKSLEEMYLTLFYY